MRDDVVEMSHGSLAEPVEMERRRSREPALDDHPLAVGHTAVTRRAKDVKALPAALQYGAINLERECLDEFVPNLTLIKMIVDAKLAPGHRTRDEWARRLAVLEKRARFERLVLRLVVHVLPTAADREEACRKQSQPKYHHSV